jgi:hypothetical protein
MQSLKNESKCSRERDSSILLAAVESRSGLELYTRNRCHDGRYLTLVSANCTAAVSSQGNIIEKDSEAIVLSRAINLD